MIFAIRKGTGLTICGIAGVIKSSPEWVHDVKSMDFLHYNCANLRALRAAYRVAVEEGFCPRAQG
jgi:hypothetical protein